MPLQVVENTRKQAELDRIAVEEMRNNIAIEEKKVNEAQQNLLAKQKDVQRAEANLQLVLNSVYPEDIEAARQEVEASRAQLGQLQQKLQYAMSQEEKTQLMMPFDGYLVDSYLNQKIGSYLNLGETYTSVQNDSNLLVEVEMPEYDAGEIPIGAKAEVKLLAYPNEPLVGQVIAIKPASSEENYGLVFSVVIQVEDVEPNLRPGMSGYGKVYVGNKLLIILLTRPLVRFLQIEFWSWLP